jgi:hypothetical protein
MLSEGTFPLVHGFLFFYKEVLPNRALMDIPLKSVLIRRPITIVTNRAKVSSLLKQIHNWCSILLHIQFMAGSYKSFIANSLELLFEKVEGSAKVGA